MLQRLQYTAALAAGVLILSGCTTTNTATAETQPVASRSTCDPDNGGITLPPGFCASVFADNLGRVRHIAVSPDGDVYANTWSSVYTNLKNAPGAYVVGLRDADRNGKAEMIQRFGETHVDGSPGGGTGIAFHRGALFVESWGTIVRYPPAGGRLVPQGAPEVVLSGLWTERGHIMHPFAITADNVMYVNSGSMSNSCQEKDRTLESPGISPCPELALHAGIWRYDAARTGQTFSAAERYATGTRNVVALAVNSNGTLYATLHGRDGLGPHWPKLYTTQQNNELPAEVFARIDRGDDFGWPYCYYDGLQKKHVLAPEYGGDGGRTQGICADKKQPALTFPAHWAPNGMTFYNASAFPSRYRGGAFVAFHGSHDRKPTQAGYRVAFVPFPSGAPSAYEDFATGFAGTPSPANPTEAQHRPMGLAVAPDGALYIADDVKGRIWRVQYVGAN
jgi:glucose/arabinose dehydrogenase